MFVNFDESDRPEVPWAISPVLVAVTGVRKICSWYNDIVTTIGKGNGAMLVLLDLSAAFDTIDHDNLFCIRKNMSEFMVMH